MFFFFSPLAISSMFLLSPPDSSYTGSSKCLFFAAGFLSLGPSSLYNLVPSLYKPPSRFMMHTICGCSVSCVSSVDPSSSVSQLNSSIEFFSQLPIFRVGSTCSSSSFGFCIFSVGSLLHSLILHEALSLGSPSILPNTSLQFRFFIFSHRLTFSMPIFTMLSDNCVDFHFVSTFLF